MRRRAAAASSRRRPRRRRRSGSASRCTSPRSPSCRRDVDRVVVCAYGLYIPPRLLERSLLLNVHPSLLPRWRGAAPVERAILAGDEETGVTIHETVAELDAGPIAAQERVRDRRRRCGRGVRARRRGRGAAARRRARRRRSSSRSRGRVDVRREDHACRPRARPRRSARRMAAHPRAVAAHRRARRAARARA